MLKLRFLNYHTTGYLIFFLSTLITAGPGAHAASSDSAPIQEESSQQTLRQKSLDPTSDLKQIHIQNRFIPSTFKVDGYANLLNLRLWYPIPQSSHFPVRQVMRFTVPILTAPGGPTGLSDLQFFDIFILGERELKKGRWWRVGVGPSFVFPTASKDVLGLEKWQVGPVFAGIFHAEKWQLALLVQNLFSFAGNSQRPDVNRFIWQPILVYWLPDQWYLGLQGTPKSVNWEKNNAITFPVSFRIGKVTTFGRRAVNVFVEPEYTAIHEEGPLPEWSVLLGFNFLFPL